MCVLLGLGEVSGTGIDRERDGAYGWKSAEIYCGAMPWSALKVRSSTLNCVRLFMGSQCRLDSMDVVEVREVARSVISYSCCDVLYALQLIDVVCREVRKKGVAGV